MEVVKKKQIDWNKINQAREQGVSNKKNYKEDATTLTQFYDDLKSKLDDTPVTNTINVGTNGLSSPNAAMWRNMASRECDKLKDNCCKHMILDIYCKVLPFDQDYKCGHMGQMRGDVDAMLANKGMSATQYLTSAFESTGAPLLEFLLRSCEGIGRSFMEEADEKLKDAQEKNIDVPAPEAPSVDDKEIESQLVDVEKDTEYSTFIEKLKEKTIKKIVDDVSKIINSKKEENNMAFNPKPEVATESATSIALDYLQTRLIKENVEVAPEKQDELIGMAIREATLNQLDVIFKQPSSSLREFESNIRYGKGIVVNESCTQIFREDATQRFEPLYKETNGGKYDVANYEKIENDGKKTPMTDQEAKQVLDPEGYKKYQNRPKTNQ